MMKNWILLSLVEKHSVGSCNPAVMITLTNELQLAARIHAAGHPGFLPSRFSSGDRRFWVARTHSGAGKAAAGRRPQSVRGRPQVRLNWGTLRLQALKLKLHRVMDSAVVEQNVLELAVMPANGK